MLQCFLNQLVGVQSTVNGQPSATIEYTYDGTGNRYSKTVNGQTRYYSYDTSGNIVSEYKRVILNGNEESQTDVRYVRDNTGKAISMLHYGHPSSVDGQRTYYFIYNGHGDVTALTDNTGTVVATYSYDEFGNEVIGSRSSVNEQGIYNPLRYSGANNAYYDSETASAGSAQDGLYKMGTRYYQPDIGRWLTRDSLKDTSPESLNKYMYASNNPLAKVDPSGYKDMTTKDALGKAKKGDIVLGRFSGWDSPITYQSYYTHAMQMISGTKIAETVASGTRTIDKNDILARGDNRDGYDSVAVLKVNADPKTRKYAVKLATNYGNQHIHYSLNSYLNKKSDGMNCTELIWRAWYIASKHTIDFDDHRHVWLRTVAPEAFKASKYTTLKAFGRKTP